MELKPVVREVADNNNPRWRGLFPTFNKQDHIDNYTKQLNNSDYEVQDSAVKITHIAVMSPKEFDWFTTHLLDDQPWLNDLGGIDSDYISEKYQHLDDNEFWHMLHNDKRERQLWIEQSYRLVVKVIDGDRTIYVDPQGYKYARYVGFPLC